MRPVGVETTPVLEREEFLREYWDYKPGEHVTIIGPTGRGKTTFGLQLLNVTASKNLRAYVLVSKPRDATMDEWTKKLHFKTIETYPPPPVFFKSRRPRGYMLKPYQSLRDLDDDERRLKKEFTDCIMDCYSSKDARIVFVDEAQELQDNRGLKLKKELEACWKRGRSLNCGLWALAQRSAYNSQDMYNAPEHLFLMNDPDKKNRIRFSEIGGVDPELIMYVTDNLQEYQLLYIKRTGKYTAVINP